MMSSNDTARSIAKSLREVTRIWLFLDYDGTLDDFAPTPADVLPNPEVIDLVHTLVCNESFRVAVISGRRLDQIKRLLPVPRLLLAGTYGLEMRTLDGREVTRLAYEEVRPRLRVLRQALVDILAAHSEFFLEDKGWTLAIHGRYADEETVKLVLDAAHRLAKDILPESEFRLLRGRSFFEAAPAMANKGEAAAYILNAFNWSRSVPLYIGDDDKDMEAFPVISARGGFTCLVGDVATSGVADFSLPSPQAVRTWLRTLIV